MIKNFVLHYEKVESWLTFLLKSLLNHAKSISLGIFPYEYAKSIAILKATLGIPPRHCFASKLTGQTEISQEDHDFCWEVFRLFECTNLYSYLQVYNHIGM